MGGPPRSGIWEFDKEGADRDLPRFAQNVLLVDFLQRGTARGTGKLDARTFETPGSCAYYATPATADGRMGASHSSAIIAYKDVTASATHTTITLQRSVKRIDYEVPLWGFGAKKSSPRVGAVTIVVPALGATNVGMIGYQSADGSMVHFGVLLHNPGMFSITSDGGSARTHYEFAVLHILRRTSNDTEAKLDMYFSTTRSDCEKRISILLESPRCCLNEELTASSRSLETLVIPLKEVLAPTFLRDYSVGALCMAEGRVSKQVNCILGAVRMKAFLLGLDPKGAVAEFVEKHKVNLVKWSGDATFCPLPPEELAFPAP